jgi:hypothetical protein
MAINNNRDADSVPSKEEALRRLEQQIADPDALRLGGPLMTSPSAFRSAGVYRVPYKNGTPVRVSNDEGSHFPPRKYDLVGTGGTGIYRVVAAAAGRVRRIEDTFNENLPNGNPCHNNYVWIEHPNGEWSKYTHLRQGSVADAGIHLGLPVAAGRELGLEGKVGCAHGQHLHFEVAVPLDPNPNNAVDADGDIIGGHQRNRIPWICGIDGRRFVAGQTLIAGPCPFVDVSALPPVVRFAPVAIGQGATQICTVVNLGLGDATVRVAASPGGSVFAWFPVTKTLARGEFVDVPIRFTPTQLLPAQATMTVAIDGRRSVVVGIAGLGKGPEPKPTPRLVAEPASVRFGSVVVGQRATKTCTLVNRGDRAAAINVAGSPSGSAFEWFLLNLTLAAGESVTIPIRFTPSGVGTAQATLTVTVAGGAPVKVDITGDGTPRLDHVVPLVRNARRDAAFRLVNEADLIAVFTGSQDPDAFVFSQSPRERTRVAADTPVRMTMQIGEPR